MSKSVHRRRRKSYFRRRTKPGSPPGELLFDPQAPRPRVHLMAYGPENLEEREVQDVEALQTSLGAFPVTWVNVEGVSHGETIRQLGRIFRLHPLALEDVVNVHQRAKVEQYGDQTYVVLRMPHSNARLETEQVSIFIRSNCVLTFQECPGDVFEGVRVSLRGSAGRIRRAGAGYLAYALIDAVVDAYFPLVESFGERLDALEDEVIDRPNKRAIAKVHDAKHDLRTLRRAVWPLRDAISSLYRDNSALFDEDTRIHLRDCYDHAVQIIDIVETYRELGADLTDLYLSSLSTRMNEVMKVLTVIATLFMPLSFITGLYGMNFNPEASHWNMPELNWRYGYTYALSLMAVSALGMLLFFQRRGWLQALTPGSAGNSAPSEQEGD